MEKPFFDLDCPCRKLCGVGGFRSLPQAFGRMRPTFLTQWKDIIRKKSQKYAYKPWFKFQIAKI